MYRIVQEAMTNCARHAEAKNIQICVNREGAQLRVSVTDDGVGLDPAHVGRGLGLRGIEERVKELHGTLTISRGPRRGTTLVARLPLPAASEVPLARAAG
jgi:signal transduction histidine kinase